MTAVVKSTLRQIRWERKIFWRNPASAGFTFAFPLMFLVIFAAINGNDTHPSRARHREVRAVLRSRDRRVRCHLGVLHEPRVHDLDPSRPRRVETGTRHAPLAVDVPRGHRRQRGRSCRHSSPCSSITLGLTAYGVTLPHRYLPPWS